MAPPDQSANLELERTDVYSAGAAPRVDARRERFERLALPHLDAAYTLAGWLAGNAADAEDVVQEAYLRAFRYFDAFHGGDMRVWLLAIVRTSFATWARANRSGRMSHFGVRPDDEGTEPVEPMWSHPAHDPEAFLIATRDGERLNQLMIRLPSGSREVLVLREVEDLSYREIATIAGVPIGTVMSRLSRARMALRRMWLSEMGMATAAR